MESRRREDRATVVTWNVGLDRSEKGRCVAYLTEGHQYCRFIIQISRKAKVVVVDNVYGSMDNIYITVSFSSIRDDKPAEFSAMISYAE